MSKLSLEIKTATWGRETHGLFDYENSSSSKSKLLITENSWILRNTESVSSYPMNSSTQILDNNVFLGTVKFEGSASIFNRSSEERSAIDKTNCDKVWLVVKSLDRGYRISTGDVMRLGRVHMRVSELGGIREAEPYSPNAVKCKKLGDGGLNKNSKLSSKKDPLHVGMCDTDTEEEGSGKQPCRICLSEVSDDSDPLISPCKCTGTMGRVHLKCLQQWFNSKISARERMNAMSFSWKALECELCKLPYPEKIELNGICHHLIEIPKPEGSYIILEALGKDKNTKTYHVISLLNKNYVRLGRGHDSDVRFFDDISVSRNHAFLKIIQGGLYLMDNQSKFGTLVLVKRPIVIDYGTKLCIQTGRTYLELAMKKQNNWFGCFGCSKVKERKLKRENTQREEI